MGSNGAYGTDYEISVFVRHYGMPLIIYRTLESGKVTKVQTLRKYDNNGNGDCLKIMFTGNQHSGHWIILEKIREPVNNKKVGESAPLKKIVESVKLEESTNVPKTEDTVNSNKIEISLPKDTGRRQEVGRKIV